MTRLLKTAIAAGLMVAFGSAMAYAQAQPAQLLKYRQGVMRAVAFQFGPLTGCWLMDKETNVVFAGVASVSRTPRSSKKSSLMTVTV